MLIYRDSKTYNEGRCMLTNKNIVWRNIPNGKTEPNRLLFDLKHIKSITTKSKKFSSSKLIINLKTPSNNNTSPYIQLGFKTGTARATFLQQLQKLIHTVDRNDNADKYDKFEKLIDVINRENVIDDIYSNYKSLSQFLTMIKQNYSSNIHLLNIINKLLVEHDDKTCHLKSHHQLSQKEQSIMVQLYFNQAPYIKLSEYKISATGKIYLDWLLINMTLCKLCASLSSIDIFPIKITKIVQQKWIEQLLKCTWYFPVDDMQTNTKCVQLLDIWMKRIWRVESLDIIKDIKLQSYDNPQQLSYSNLFVISHLFKHYIKPETSTNIGFSWVMLKNSYPLITKINGYAECFVDILNLKSMEWNDINKFRESLKQVQAMIVELITKYDYGKNDYLVRELREWIRNNKSYDNCYMKQYQCLHLQTYIKHDIDQDRMIEVMENSMLIDMQYLDSKWSGLYFGLNALQFAKYRDGTSQKIIDYLQQRMEIGYNSEDYAESKVGNDDDDELIIMDESKSNETEHIKERGKSRPKKKNVTTLFRRKSKNTLNLDEKESAERALKRRVTAPPAISTNIDQVAIPMSSTPETEDDAEYFGSQDSPQDADENTKLPLMSLSQSEDDGKRDRNKERGRKRKKGKRKAVSMKTYQKKRELHARPAISTPPPVINTPISSMIIKEDQESDNEGSNNIEYQPFMIKTTDLNGKAKILSRRRHDHHRSAPTTPLKAHKNKIGRNSAAKLKSALNIHSIEVASKKNNKRINDLERKLNKAQKEIIHLKTKMGLKYEDDEEKMMQQNINDELLKYDALLIKNLAWKKWTFLEIIQWIIQLEEGRFEKYKNVLYIKMKSKNMKGIYLEKMEKIDLDNFFGINDFGDICDLWNHIKQLLNEERDPTLAIMASQESESMFEVNEVDSILMEIIEAETNQMNQSIVD